MGEIIPEWWATSSGISSLRTTLTEEQSAPLLTALELWLREQRPRLSNSSSIAKPIDYTLRRWDRFARFTDDGRICLTNERRSARCLALPWDASPGSLPAPNVVPIAPPSWRPSS